MENPGFILHSMIRTRFFFGAWSTERSSCPNATDFQNISDGGEGEGGSKPFLPAVGFCGHELEIAVKTHTAGKKIYKFPQNFNVISSFIF